MWKALKKNLVYLAMLSFIFIASSALSLSKTLGENKVKAPQETYVEEVKAQKTFTPIPILFGAESFPILSAQAVLAFDPDSGITFYEKNPDGFILPASTTKIVTALVALDYYPLDQVITVKNVGVEGQRMNLYAGEEITANDLLHGLLVFSANDAAEVLAQNYCAPLSAGVVESCGRDAFMTAMNFKAQELKLSDTFFVNPTGLDAAGHITTARDLVRVSMVAMQNPIFREIVGKKEYLVRDARGLITHRLRNINELVGEVEGVLGIKTGWTENARENLVSFTQRDNKKVFIAILGSQDRFGETKELIEWIYRNYRWQEVIVDYSP